MVFLGGHQAKNAPSIIASVGDAVAQVWSDKHSETKRLNKRVAVYVITPGRGEIISTARLMAVAYLTHPPIPIPQLYKSLL